MDVSLIDGHIDEPEKTMTNNEIVKAFKCCADINDKCPECPLKDKSRESCVGILMSYALDLINHQNAEIWGLNESNDALEDKLADYRKRNEELITELNRQKAENKELQDCIDEQDIEIASLWKRIEEAKAEAYKEFAERLNKEIDIRPTYSNKQNEYVCFLIDNLLKELVGENNV